MKQLLLLFFLIFSNSLSYGCKYENTDSLYQVESFSFHVFDGKRLSGELTIPDKFDKFGKIVILTIPPQPKDRNYETFYLVLADILSKAGVSTLRYDNRAFCDTSVQKDGVSMFLQAKDLRFAVETLQKDS